jgi:hypothetical protein
LGKPDCGFSKNGTFQVKTPSYFRKAESKRRREPQLLGAAKPNQPHNGHDKQSKSDDNGASENVQFGLEFMIYGGNSVQQMIDGASFDNARGHDRIFLSKLRAIRHFCQIQGLLLQYPWPIYP